MNKICIKCHRELDINCFRKSGKYYRSECKECAKTLYKEWYNKNKEKRKQHNRDKAKKSYYKNREYYLENAKLYRETHKEEIREYKKVYYERKNKDKVYKRKNAPLYIRKLKKQVRCMLYDSFKRQHKIKKEHSEEILGCSLDFFVGYLLGTYKAIYGIEWDKKEKVHIDHIIPLAFADTEEDILILCHYSNLQLLKAKDNLKKSDKTILGSFGHNYRRN